MMVMIMLFSILVAYLYSK
uniref:Uncharacterized protein n=12 Tax=Nymphaea colorata TaxID=210225 RepID=A0A5K1GUM4_9MAGN